MASVFKRGGAANGRGNWLISWIDHNGDSQCRSSGTKNHKAAEQIAAQIEADAARFRWGVIDPTLAAIAEQSQREIKLHLRDYAAALRTRGSKPGHVDRQLQRIEAICQAVEFRVAGDIRADGVNAFAARLRDEAKSPNTIRNYLVAIGGFTRWLVTGEKLPRDPLAPVKKPGAKKAMRRMLLMEEWPHVVAATLSGPVRYGMAGVDRVLLYRTAIETGLRSDELRKLRRSDAWLTERSPFIRARAETTKDRREAKQFIEAELAQQLREHLATKLPAAPIFDLPDPTDMARMLRADLTAARRAWCSEAGIDAAEQLRRDQSDFLAEENHDGLRVDFHCLRYSAGGWRRLLGWDMKQVQEFMRHKDSKLTMDTYGQLVPGELAGLADSLGSIFGDDHDRGALAATGTYDENSTPQKKSARACAARTALTDVVSKRQTLQISRVR